MKARFIVALLVAFSFLGTGLFAGQQTTQQPKQPKSQYKVEKVHYKKSGKKAKMSKDSTAKKSLRHGKKSSAKTNKGNK